MHRANAAVANRSPPRSDPRLFTEIVAFSLTLGYVVNVAPFEQWGLKANQRARVHDQESNFRKRRERPSDLRHTWRADPGAGPRAGALCRCDADWQPRRRDAARAGHPRRRGPDLGGRHAHFANLARPLPDQDPAVALP